MVKHCRTILVAPPQHHRIATLKFTISLLIRVWMDVANIGTRPDSCSNAASIPARRFSAKAAAGTVTHRRNAAGGFYQVSTPPDILLNVTQGKVLCLLKALLSA
jgi:hypothetical protein